METSRKRRRDERDPLTNTRGSVDVKSPHVAGSSKSFHTIRDQEWRDHDNDIASSSPLAAGLDPSPPTSIAKVPETTAAQLSREMNQSVRIISMLLHKPDPNLQISPNIHALISNRPLPFYSPELVSSPNEPSSPKNTKLSSKPKRKKSMSLSINSPRMSKCMPLLISYSSNY